MIVDKLENTLNGGFAGLYGEVVMEDTYKLKSLGFIPEIIFDIGSNIGVFTRYARELFPKAIIICVEPNPENFVHLKRFTHPSLVTFINKALGQGKLHHATTAVNGSGEVYMSEGLGYPSDQIHTASNLEPSSIETVMLDELINTYLQPGTKSLLKLDCEGAENVIWQHKPSMKALSKIDYICAELHFYALHGGTVYDEVQYVTRKALKSLEETHTCILDGVHFYATKK